MNDLVVKSVDLFGDTVMAAQDKDGNIWAGINFFCRGLGMSKRQRDFQVEKVKADKVLSRGCTLLRAGALDQANEVYALRIDFVPIWLSKITITKKMEEEVPDLANKLFRYQLKAKDILAAAFLPKQEYTGDVHGKIKLLAQGTTELYERVGGLEEKFKNFEDSLPLFPEDADKIKDALNKKVVDYLGGKESNAYHDRSLRMKIFIDAYRELKRNFGVSSYKSIKRNQRELALQVIESYRPPIVLLDQIQMANAQQTLDFEGGTKQC